jgi:DNA-binding LytR/AlgR family response regulator
MQTLIIEDEIPAARQLAKMLETQASGIQIVATIDSVEGAVRWLTTSAAPDLIFMDIQIADGLSFDIFRQVKITSPVIFTTAFDQYAIQAFRVNAIDYLLKPVDPDELTKALDKIWKRPEQSSFTDIDALLRHFKTPEYKDRFLVKTGQQLLFLLASDIAFFRSSDGLTQAHTHAGKRHFVEHSIEELEKLLHPRDFFRVSRSMPLHIQSIKAIHPHLNGRLKLDISPALSEDVFVSRERVSEFKTWLGG